MRIRADSSSPSARLPPAVAAVRPFASSSGTKIAQDRRTSSGSYPARLNIVLECDGDTVQRSAASSVEQFPVLQPAHRPARVLLSLCGRHSAGPSRRSIRARYILVNSTGDSFLLGEQWLQLLYRRECKSRRSFHGGSDVNRGASLTLAPEADKRLPVLHRSSLPTQVWPVHN